MTTEHLPRARDVWQDHSRRAMSVFWSRPTYQCVHYNPIPATSWPPDPSVQSAEVHLITLIYEVDHEATQRRRDRRDVWRVRAHCSGPDNGAIVAEGIG